MNGKLLFTAIGMAVGVASTSAHAAFADFCVNAAVAGAGGGNYNTLVNGPNGCSSVANAAIKGFTADYLNGKYNEKINVVGTTFSSTIVANFNAFYRNEGSDIVNSTGIGNAYGLYVVVTANGNVSGPSTFTPTSATLRLYLDQDLQTQTGLTSINDTTLAFSGPGADDYLLATATYASGSGQISTSNSHFNIGFDNFTLTNTGAVNGDNFFIAPRPFHLTVFSDGDISQGTLNSTGPGSFTAGGDLSAVFNAIPEPASLALVGAALVGLGLSRKKATARTAEKV